MRENDYFLNKLTNPDFSEQDFRGIGLTTENTSIEDRETYKSLDYIQTNPLFQTDGAFDEAKFDAFYNHSLASYNQFANDETSEQIAKQDFFRNDIYANYDERTQQEETYITREANPLRQRKGLIHANDVQESPMSVREIAQTQKVWDSQTNSWQEAPNDSFFDNFFETRVLAQWDEDGEHLDPFTGQMVKHKKGEKKINENGTFYYENLNGRDVYGREVLSKFDTLTTDGSFVNKFDFFDSDDKEKSVMGTLFRNAAKVVPAFIPGVAPWYIGTRVALNTVDMISKLGKILTGSENSTLSTLEGFSKSLTFSNSDYAQGSSEAEIPAHAWSIENLLNISADTFTQLAEQRWIFKYVPSIVKGKAGWDDKAAKDLQEKILKEKNLSLDKLLTKENLERTGDSAKFLAEAEALNVLAAQNFMKDFAKDYQKIGKYISQSYMTGITVADAYGEAKAEGASDMEAALLTLGYAIGEYGIINSDLGQWILPELKAERQKFKNIAKKLYEAPKPANGATITEKSNWIKKIVNLGKKAAENDYTYWGSNMAKSMLAGAAAEGVEEVSEEALYDVSKSIFNIVNYLRGDSTQLSAFNDVGTRYGLSFVGGAIGGTIGSLQTDFQEAKKQRQWDDKAAWQELVHIVKEGEGQKFLDTINKMTWASSDLSNVNFEDAEGKRLFKKGTSKDNQNQAVKDAMTAQVQMITDILNANGGKVDDASLLNILTNADKDFRFLSLQKSTFGAQYLQELNRLDTEIVRLTGSIEDQKKKEEGEKTDGEKQAEAKQPVQKKSPEMESIEGSLKQILQAKQDLLSGKRSGEFIEKALFEMSTDISKAYMDVTFTAFAEAKENKKISEIPPEQLKKLKEDWKEYSKFKRKDDLEVAFRIFKNVNLLTSDVIQNYDAAYFQEAKKGENTVSILERMLGVRNQKLVQASDANVIPLAQAQNEVGTNYQAGESTQMMLIASMMNRMDPNLAQETIAKLELIEAIPSKQEQQDELYLLIDDIINKDPNVLNSFEQDIDKLPYLNYADRGELMKLFDISQVISDITGFPSEKAEQLQRIITKINEKPYSPILDLIDQFSARLDNQEMSTSKLVQTLQAQFLGFAAEQHIDEFSMNKDHQDNIKTALRNIKLLKASLLAARTDGVDLGNRVGFNTTSNELLQSGLAEIDKNNANVILQDLNKVENKLKYYAKIHEINSGQKLLEQDKAAANKDIIIYNKLKKFALENDNWPPKDWEGRDALKAALGSVELVNTLTNSDGTRNLSLNQEQKTQLRKDSILLEQAIHDFFLANKDKLEDEDKLSELLSGDLFDFESLDTKIMNKETDDISDASFVWWMASRAALAPNDFYGWFKESITDKMAPVSGQEQAIYTALAHVINGKVTNAFAKAYNKALVKKLKSYPEGELEKKYKDIEYRSITDQYPIDSDVAINFFRTMLIEGIAGSGKSSGVLKPIVHMLRKIDPKFVDNLWIVNTSKERAIQLAKDLGLENFEDRCFSREEMLEKLSPGISKSRNIVNDSLVLKESDLIRSEEDGLYRYKNGINKNDAPPSMIVMDEVSGFSQQDLLLVDDYSNYHGIMNIALGDFTQDGLDGEIENTKDWVSNISNGNFIHSAKLGNSFRTGNVLKDANQKSMLAAMDYDHLLDENKWNTTPEIFFKYYEDDTQILGDKFHNYNDNIADIQASVLKMLQQIPEGDKLGYVFNNRSSVIFKYLTDLNTTGEYKGRIDFKEGSSSQGEERNFYVVDLNKDKASSNRKFWKQLYTGLTRSKKGSVVITSGQNRIQSGQPEMSANDFNVNNDIISRYSEGVKKILDEVVTGNQDVKIQKFEGTKPKESSQDTIKVNGKDYTINTSIQNPPLNVNEKFDLDDTNYEVKNYLQDAEGNTYIHYSDSNTDIVEPLKEFIDKTLPKLKSSVIPTTDEEKKLRKEIHKKNSVEMDIDNSTPNELHMMLHSFATEETGLLVDDETKRYIKPANYDSRTDSLIGISKILESQGQVLFNEDGVMDASKETFLLQKLRNIRSAALYKQNKSGILATISRELNLGDYDLQARFGFGSYRVVETEDEMNEVKDFFKPLVKFVKEKILGIYTDNKNKLKPTQKTINLLINGKDKNGNTINLEIPLYNLTNPLTLMNSNSKGLESIKEKADNIVNTFKKEGKEFTGIDVLNKLREELALAGDEKSKQFSKLIDVYTKVTPGKMIFLDEFSDSAGIQGILGSSLQSTGPLIVNTAKGLDYFDDDLSYEGEWMELEKYIKESGKIVSRVMAAPNAVMDKATKTKTYIDAGSPFVIISDAHTEIGTSDNDLLEQYLAQMEDDSLPKLVKLVYVTPPYASISEYFKNLDSLYKNKGKENNEIDTQLGNILTSFRILEKLFEEDVLLDKLPQSPILKDYVARYNKFKELVGKISDKFGDDSVRLVDFLNGVVGIDDIPSLAGFSRQLTSTGNPTTAKSWKNYLQDYLRELVLSYPNSEGKNEYFKFKYQENPKTELQQKIKDKINTVTEYLNSRGIPGIFYHLHLDTGEALSEGIKRMKTDDDANTFRTKSLLINGKIDSQALKGNVVPLLDKILKAIYTKGLDVANTASFLNRNYPEAAANPDTSKEAAKKAAKEKAKQELEKRKQLIQSHQSTFRTNNSEQAEVDDLVKTYVENHLDATTEDIKKHLNENHFMVVTANGVTLTRKLSPSQEIIDDQTIKEGQITYTFAGIDENGNAVFNPNESALRTKPLEQVVTIDTLLQYPNQEALFEAYKIATTDEYGDYEELENINELVENKHIIKSFKNYYENNEEEINKLGLQEPFNLIKQLYNLDVDTTQDENNKPCPIILY